MSQQQLRILNGPFTFSSNFRVRLIAYHFHAGSGSDPS